MATSVNLYQTTASQDESPLRFESGHCLTARYRTLLIKTVESAQVVPVHRLMMARAA